MARRLAAELLGTALLLVVIVGSGVTAATDGAASAQLFPHAVVVGAGLAALIVTFGPVSGARFNPLVSAVDAVFGGLSRRLLTAYTAAQLLGAVLGVALTNLLFSLPVVTVATTDRSGVELAASEGLATFGLILVISGVVGSGRAAAVPVAVGGSIAAAIHATSSASFANPAVTLARVLSDTYTGIAPAAVPGFLVGQALGAVGAALTVRLLLRPDPQVAHDVVMPSTEPGHERSPS